MSAQPGRGRLVLGLLGVVTGGYGTWVLLGEGWDNMVATGVWLVAGVLAHDVLWAGLTAAVLAAGTRLVPPSVRATAAAALVVLATVTLTAVPVLGRFGAREDNPSLLDRSYGLGWLVLLGVVLVVAVSGELLRRALSAGPPRPAGPPAAPRSPARRVRRRPGAR